MRVSDGVSRTGLPVDVGLVPGEVEPEAADLPLGLRLGAVELAAAQLGAMRLTSSAVENGFVT